MTWPVAPLKDLIAAPLANGRSVTDQVGGFPVLRLTALRNGAVDLGEYKEGAWTRADAERFLVRAGDFLVSRGNGSLALVGRGGLVAAEPPPVAFPDTMIRVRPDTQKLEPNYLSLVWNAPVVRSQIEGSARTTAGIYKINQSQLGSVTIPVPPLDEQRRIINLLEDYLSRLNLADRSVARTRASAVAMVRTSLSAGLRADLVEDDLSEGTASDLIGTPQTFSEGADERVWRVPDTWAWVRIGDIFEVNVGATPSRAKAELWSGDLPWLSSGEVAFRRISATREHITREAAGNPRTRIHPPGTVMLAMIGEGKTRGQAAILDIEAAHNQNCASIRVSESGVLPEYIFGYLEERYIETRRGGAGGQQPALNKAAIQRFPVPIAPLGTQRLLVAAWAEVREAARRLDLDLQVATKRSNRLRQSLLAAAFSGRLARSASDGSAIEELTGR